MVEVSFAAPLDSIAAVIYCVVPEPLADELYDRLASYYEDDPNVTVIVDRRHGPAARAAADRRRPARAPRPAAHGSQASSRASPANES